MFLSYSTRAVSYTHLDVYKRQRLDLKDVMAKVEVLHPSKPEEPAKEEEKGIDLEAKPEITFDDFSKLQFQVGRCV